MLHKCRISRKLHLDDLTGDTFTNWDHGTSKRTLG